MLVSWRILFKVETQGVYPTAAELPLPILHGKHQLSFPKWPAEGSLDFLVFYSNWKKAQAFTWNGMGWFVT